jgi:hypothetical protein
MGDAAPPPAPPTPASPPPWLGFLAQYVAPTAIATVIAAAVSIYTAVGAAHEKQREYNTKFEELVTANSISGAFGGNFVDANAKTGALDAAKESYDQSVREQRAAATLLSLQSVAESETQRRTVLLIGARLLNADPGYAGTGAPAARLLTVLIDQVSSGKKSWNPGERHINEHLWDTINAQSFKDLVTAGYSSDYYNDDTTNDKLRIYWPTLNGDAPITTDPKFQILWELTQPDYNGWVHLATFDYAFPRGVTPRTASGSPQGSAQPNLPRGVAADLVKEVIQVSLGHQTANIGEIRAQYAIADPRETPAPNPAFDKKQLMDQNTFPRNLIMLRHRLLRSRPPVQFINRDGTFSKGSLGKIVGAVPAGSCITVVEPFEAVLVFLKKSVISPPPKPTPQAAASPQPASAGTTDATNRMAGQTSNPVAVQWRLGDVDLRLDMHRPGAPTQTHSSPPQKSAPSPSAAPKPPASAASEPLGGLVHMWAHVRPAADVECLAVVNKPDR